MASLRQIDAVLIGPKPGAEIPRRLLNPPPGAPQVSVRAGDITTQSCIVEGWDGIGAEPAPVWLKFPGWLPLRCAAERTEEGAVRCVFGQPLYECDVEALLGRQARSAAAAPMTQTRCTFLRT
jgi:hypothetical protein